MIVKLCKKSIVIDDTNQHECIELENYDVKFHGICSGIYMLDVCQAGGIKNIITVRSNNLVVIDKR